MLDYCYICGAALSLQGQCLKCSVGCNLDDQTESEINAPNCHKVRIPNFIRLVILIKGIFCVFFILIWRTVALYIQFNGNKAKKIHEWIEFLTRVKLSKFVGKFLVFMMVRRWFMLSVPKIICFHIFSRHSVLKISPIVNLIKKQKAGFELSYKSSFKKFFKWNQTSDLYFFFLLFCVAFLVFINNLVWQK